MVYNMIGPSGPSVKTERFVNTQLKVMYFPMWWRKQTPILLFPENTGYTARGKIHQLAPYMPTDMVGYDSMADEPTLHLPPHRTLVSATVAVP